MSEPSAYLPRNKRVKEISFSLTERDLEILKAVNRCRFLRTGQIKRLVFAENRSLQSTRRRLRYLYHNGLLGRVVPFVQIGSGGEETAYFLDREGQRFLHEQGIPPLSYSKTGQVRRAFLHHALDLSEFRVCLELALAAQDRVALHRFICDFELKGHTDRALGTRRYKLYDQVTHPATRKSFVVYPDALIILQGTGKYEKFQVLYFLEVDRGTESLSVIRDKLIGYGLYLEQKIFTKYGKFASFKVLLETTSDKRAANIAAALHDTSHSDLLLITVRDQVYEDTVLKAPIWKTTAGEETTLVKSKDNSE